MRRFKNILFFADGDAADGAAMRRAIALAERNQARLTVVDVIEPVETPKKVSTHLGGELTDLLRERRLQMLDALVEPFKQADTLIYAEVFSGIPFVEVIRAVRRSRYDLVMKAARPPIGVSERLFGSTDMHLLRKCPCPVWIDHPGAAESYRTVLAAVDPTTGPGAGCDPLVMDLAGALARQEGATLAVVHAWRLEGESMLRHGRFRMPDGELDDLMRGTEARRRERLDELLRSCARDGVAPEVHLVRGAAAAVIRQTAETLPADVIVMGTAGRTGIPGFFIGNTAEEVLQTARASILAVKPPGFVSPVG
jgi:nucleotide-binding universal stress UspA family protein